MNTLKIFAFGIALVAVPNGASAAVMIATYTASVDSGLDQGNLFGGAENSSLVGLEAILQFTVDTTRGTFDGSQFLDGGVASHFGAGDNNPILSSSFTLNGVTLNLLSGGNGYEDRQINIPNAGMDSSDSIKHAVDFGIHTPFGYSGHMIAVFHDPRSQNRLQSLDFSQPVPRISPILSAFSRGTFVFRNSHETGIVDEAYGDLEIRSLTIVAAGVVPEPSVWAMMISGFALIGGMMRRAGRRQAALAAA